MLFDLCLSNCLFDIIFGPFIHIINTRTHTPNTNYANTTVTNENVNITDTNNEKTIINFKYCDLDKMFSRTSEETNDRDIHTAVIIGKRETGKTILMQDIAKKMIHINNIEEIIHFKEKDMISVEKIEEMFYFPQLQNEKLSTNTSYTICAYDTEMLDKIIIKQNNNKSKPILILFDDVFYDNNIKDEKFMTMLWSAKTLNIFIIIVYQFPTAFGPVIRNNFDAIFAFKDSYIGNKHRLYERYYGCFPTFEQFNTFMNELSEYESMVFDCSIDVSSDFEDKIGWYKVKCS